MKIIINVLFVSILISSCAVTPIEELDDYRDSASGRCSGKSYKESLGSNGGLSVAASASVSEKLLTKGYGTGSLNIGVSLQEKTELSSLLGGLNKEQVENFLNKYESCMIKEMESFFKVKEMKYPKKPKTSSVVWGNEVLTASETIVANRTEKSGNWRSYDACVSIPENGFMLKKSTKTEVISGVPAGSWGTWRKDIRYINNNAYGPTKVCRAFDHQIHDQDRVLKISVKYKIPVT